MAEHMHGAVARALHQITVGTARAIRAKDRNDVDNRPCEMEQQYQFAVSGKGGTEPTFGEAEVIFRYSYHFAPANRNSNLEFPQFTFGSHTTPPVFITATVTEWLHDEKNGAIIGARVAIGVIGTGNFKGFVHLTFQGYGALIEPDDDFLVNSGLPEEE